MGPMEVVGLFLLCAISAVLVVLPAIIGYRLGLKHDHEVMGLLLGLVLSWLGVLIMALLPEPAAATSLVRR